MASIRVNLKKNVKKCNILSKKEITCCVKKIFFDIFVTLFFYDSITLKTVSCHAKHLFFFFYCNQCKKTSHIHYCNTQNISLSLSYCEKKKSHSYCSIAKKLYLNCSAQYNSKNISYWNEFIQISVIKTNKIWW